MSAFLPASVPPGWYPDPEGHPQQRWWTGSGWTANTAPSGSAPAAPAHSFAPLNAAPPAQSFRPMAAATSPAAALPFAPSPAVASAPSQQPFASALPFAPAPLPFAPAPELAERTEQPEYQAHPYQPQASSAFPTSVSPVQPGQIASPPALPGMAALPAYAAAPQSALAGLPGPAMPSALPTAASPLAIAQVAEPAATTSFQSTTVQSTTTTVTEHTTTETTATSAPAPVPTPAPAPLPEQEAIPGLSYPSATSPDNFASPVTASFTQRFASTAYASAQDYAIAETKSPESSTFTSSPYVAGTPFEAAPAAPFVPSDSAGAPALAPFPAPSTTTPAIPAFSVTAFAQAPIATAPAAPSTASFAQQSFAAKSLTAGSVNTQFSGAVGATSTSTQSTSAQAVSAQSFAAQSFAGQSSNTVAMPQYSRSTEFTLGTFEPTVQYEALKGDSRKRMAREPQVTYTAAVWAMVLTPLVVVGAAVALVMFAAEYYTGIVQLGLIALGAVATLLFALGDHRVLVKNGHKRAASPAWVLLTPLVYLTARFIRTRSETRKGVATLLVWLLIAAAIAAGTVLLPELTATLTAFSL